MTAGRIPSGGRPVCRIRWCAFRALRSAFAVWSSIQASLVLKILYPPRCSKQKVRMAVPAERGHCLVLKQFFLDRSYAMMARRAAFVRSGGAYIKNMLQ